MSLCNNFINRPINSYRPLACRPVVVTTKELGGHGLANRQELFFITKPNTFREHATLDLLFPIPDFIRIENTPHINITDTIRVTDGDRFRTIDTGLIRVIH